MAFTAFLLPLLLQATSAAPADAAAQAQPVRLAANETSATRAAAPKDKEKLICKRRPKTGSLAGSERSCHTRAEWEKIGAQWRDTWQEVQGAKGSTHGG